MTDSIYSVNIRAIQHYMYCPRRFALLEVNDDWAENAYVVKANLMHENVHDGEHEYTSKEKVVKNSVALYNDDYDIFGVADCIEFLRYSEGVSIPSLDGQFKVRIVEYKPKPPKDGDYHESDAIQVFAQKICADYVWKCNSEAFLYYSEKRRRVKLPFDDKAIYEKYYQMLREFVSAMRVILEREEIPPRLKSQKCSGCSLSDFCFPKSSKYNVHQRIIMMGGIES